MRISPVVGILLLVAGCEKESKPAAAPAPAPAPSAPPAPAAAPPDAPLALNEARYREYVQYRQALSAAFRDRHAEFNKKREELAKDKSSSAGAAFANAMAKMGQDIASDKAALQSKYHLTDNDDRRIGEAISAVVNANIADNALMAPTIEKMKKEAAAPGPGQEQAKRFLEEQQVQKEKGMASARASFGKDAIDVLSGHKPELQALYNEAVAAEFGGVKPPGANPPHK